jgi:hypothetical protein
MYHRRDLAIERSSNVMCKFSIHAYLHISLDQLISKLVLEIHVDGSYGE